MACTFVSCHKKAVNPNENISLDDFAQMSDERFALNSRIIRLHIDSLMSRDDDSLAADYRTRSYYRNRGPFLWIDRHGVDAKADTVVKWLNTIDKDGLSKRKFRVAAIVRDLALMRELKVDSGFHDVNAVMARIEYNLTKAYLRYSSGQRFGYVNPHLLFNRLDLRDNDRPEGGFRTLFDVKTDEPSRGFYALALRMVAHDSVGLFLREAQPRNPRYLALRSLLQKRLSQEERQLVLVNMERERWRRAEDPSMYDKYVMVNIPSFALYAIDGSDTLAMRIGCGSLKTKTPLLTSRLKRMDINPRWYIPRSIVDKDVARHAGNLHYFQNHRFEVYDRNTGQTVAPTWEALHSTDYYVVQRGGEGNALGRIIFRFDNNFSVYLHHTSTTDVFDRADRDVSHGCVRVERPYALAAFLLGKGHEDDLRRISYSMTADISPLGKDKKKLTEDEQQILDTLQRDLLVNSVKVSPPIPLFITYNTFLPLAGGRFMPCRDVYGYDAVLLRELKQIID